LSADGSELIVGVDGAGVDDQGVRPSSSTSSRASSRPPPTASDRRAEPDEGPLRHRDRHERRRAHAVGTAPWLKIGAADQRGAAYVIDLTAARP